MESALDLTALLVGLRSAGVDFVVVGGVAAVSQGVPTTTLDLDIVPCGEAGNLTRLFDHLCAIHARFRGRPGEQVPPPVLQDFRTGGHVLLMTDLGALDVLGFVEDGLDYAALLPHSLEIEIRAQRVRVLALEKLVELKRRSTRGKDRLILALLDETLRRREG